MNILGIASKISAESLLSLYPSFVKNINMDLGTQLWSRFFIYVFLSSFFVDWGYIRETLTTTWGLLLVFVTMIHVYTSYRGFQLLEGGIAYSIFYTYPLLILLMSREPIHPILIFSLIGVYILSTSEDKKEESLEPQTKSWYEKYEGLIMVFLAALTEAFIYFIVKNLPTKNNWNHIFLSYGLGAFGLSAYYGPSLVKQGLSATVGISLVINAIIGLFGYLLRFYSIGVLPPILYSSLSYVGIFMAYVYGVIFNGDKITLAKIGGTLMILLSNLFVVYQKYMK